MRADHWRPFLLAAMAGWLPFHADADPERGVWFWGSTQLAPGLYSNYGSIDVVGEPLAEDETVNFWNLHKVKRVYGSYQNRPVSEPGTIKAWNSKLDAAGIQSQLLLSGFEDIDHLIDTTHAHFVEKVQERLIDFNDGASSADEMFDALHLDLEPQMLPEWSGTTPAVKRIFLDHLLDAYVDLRAVLDAGGYASVPMYADIPWSWDKLPGDGGSIGWADTTDRDDWYADIGVPLEGISVMTFTPSKDTLPEIDDATAFERTGTFPGNARVGIQAKVGAGEIWPTLTDFQDIVGDLDTSFGPDEATDIENYGFWRDAFPPPVFTTSGSLTVDDVVGTVFVFHFTTGHSYFLRHSTDLGNTGWTTIRRVRVEELGNKKCGWFRIPVQLNGPSGYLSVIQVPEPSP